MKQSRFSEEQIIAILREQEAGEDGGRVPQVWDFGGGVYKWKARFGGMDVDEARS